MNVRVGQRVWILSGEPIRPISGIVTNLEERPGYTIVMLDNGQKRMLSSVFDHEPQFVGETSYNSHYKWV